MCVTRHQSINISQSFLIGCTSHFSFLPSIPSSLLSVLFSLLLEYLKQVLDISFNPQILYFAFLIGKDTYVCPVSITTIWLSCLREFWKESWKSFNNLCKFKRLIVSNKCIFVNIWFLWIKMQIRSEYGGLWNSMLSNTEHSIFSLLINMWDSRIRYKNNFRGCVYLFLLSDLGRLGLMNSECVMYNELFLPYDTCCFWDCIFSITKEMILNILNVIKSTLKVSKEEWRWKKREALLLRIGEMRKA